MSLTREQWTDMWNSLKKMEVMVNTPTNRPPFGVHRMNLMCIEITKMKKQIESVIGEMK